MNCKRIGRTLICLLLVCVLMVNASPIRAEAISTGLAFAAGSAVASALIGLGISMGTEALAYNELVQEAVEALKVAGYVTAAGTIALTSIGSGRYAVSENVLAALRSWLFDVEVVKPGFQAGTGYANYSIGNLDVQLDSDHYNIQGVFVGVQEGTEINEDTLYTVYCVAEKLSYSVGFDVYGASYVSSYKAMDLSIDAEDTYYRVTGRHVQGYYGPYYELPQNDVLNIKAAILQLIPGLSSTTTDYDVDLNFVANPELSLADGYAEWAANSVVIDGVTYYPVAIGKTLEETQSMTQTDVWAGNGTYVETGTDSGTQSGLLSDVLTAIKAIPAQFADWFADVISWGQSIWEAIIALPQAIVSGIAEVLADIFIPSTDFLTAKVTAIRAEYAFADSVIATGQFIGTALAGLDVEPPVIYIHLEDTEGSYDIGDTVPFIDMTWYSRYKPTVDLLISALLWIVFAWRVFVKLPGIIGGMPGDFVMDALNHIGFADHMPSRKAEYEVQRISLREQIRRGKK